MKQKVYLFTKTAFVRGMQCKKLVYLDKYCSKLRTPPDAETLARFKKGRDFETAFTRWMGRHSFGLYVFHYFGISAVALYFGKTGMLPAPITYLLSLIAGFAAGYLLNAIISRLPFFRWAVLGIRKGKENVQG